MKHFVQKLLWKFSYDLSRLNKTDLKIKELIKELRPIVVEDKKLIRIGKNTEIDGNYLIPDDINGIANYLATLGSIGVLLLIIAFKKTYRQLRLLYGNITFALSLILFTVSFSFAFPFTPLFGVFMVYFLVPSVDEL